VLGGEDVVEQGGLARAEVAGEHGDGHLGVGGVEGHGPSSRTGAPGGAALSVSVIITVSWSPNRPRGSTAWTRSSPRTGSATSTASSSSACAAPAGDPSRRGCVGCETIMNIVMLRDHEPTDTP